MLELAETDQISALSWQVDQPVSVAPNWARTLPLAWPDGERLLTLQPDYTVFASGEGGRVAALLERADYSSFELAWGESFETVRANLRALGHFLGRDNVAERKIDQLEQRLEALRIRSESRGIIPRVVYLSSSGGSAGSGTYVDAAIQAAGGRNVIGGAGAMGWTRGEAEFALTLEADLVVTSYFVDGYASIFNRGSRHSAYEPLLDGTMRVDIPSGYWPCAGPHLIDAAEMIADALDQWALDQWAGHQ